MERLLGLVLAALGVAFLVLKIKVLHASAFEIALSLALVATGLFMAIARPRHT